MTEDNAPRGPSHPRNKPFYINPLCEDCHAPLVLAYLLDKPDTPASQVWYDEFKCPVCNDGLYMDLPPEELAELKARSSAKDTIELADNRAEGGLHFMILPEALEELQKTGLDIHQIIEQIEDAESLKQFNDLLNGKQS